LLREVFGSKRFQSGNISTKFLAEEYPGGFKGHILDKESLFQLACVAALVHAKRDVRNWCWGEGQEALLKGDLAGVVPKRWDLYVKINNSQGGLEVVHVEVERKSQSLQGTAVFQV